MDKIEVTTKKDVGGKKMKFLTIGKSKIPLTDEEYAFISDKIDEHVNKYGLNYGFVFNLFMKDLESEK